MRVAKVPPCCPPLLRYVGNLPWAAQEQDLHEVFRSYGPVASAHVLKDRLGRSKGFGFVTFENEDAAKEAVAKGNGADLDGRKLKVDLARPMEPREDRGSRGGNSRGGERGDRGGRW